jgi:hypothetical protein
MEFPFAQPPVPAKLPKLGKIQHEATVFSGLIAPGQVLQGGQQIGMVGFEAVTGGTRHSLRFAMTGQAGKELGMTLHVDE